MFKRNKNKSKGFTLIELLVVVSIISLLSSIVFASINTARAKGRNAARLSAIHTLRNAFNLSLVSTLPNIGASTWACVSASCTGGLAAIGTPSAANTELTNFLTPSLAGGQKPTDPSDNTRGLAGFVYTKPFGANGQALLMYYVEPGGSCGMGTPNTVGASYTQCLLYLD